MLDLDLMRSIKLSDPPQGQILTGYILIGIFERPWSPTQIIVEGLENLPRQGRVFLAINHTDRFNYWPLQYHLWRTRSGIYTATWVKGKYFNHRPTAKFLTATNNIPTPSRGYLITTDAVSLLGHAPAQSLYRILRDQLDLPDDQRDVAAAREAARAQGQLIPLERLLKTPRSMLGTPFDPDRHSYFQGIDAAWRALMEQFVALNEQAFSLGHQIIVFPEGTRSLTLAKGRPGLAQMALRMNATIVPIGCSGCDKLYPGSSPISAGGRVIYRIGEPLTPQGELAPFQIDAPYTPFTASASRLYGDRFEQVTDLVMNRISDLIEPQYRACAGASTAVTDINRFR